MSTVTAKIQVYVSSFQAENLKATTDAYSEACNWLSKHVFETKDLNQASLNKHYYADLRRLFELKSQDGTIVISAS